MLAQVRIPVCVVVVTCTAALTIGHAQGGSVVTACYAQSPLIWLPFSGDAFVRQSVAVHLSGGPNTLSFALGRLDVPLDVLDLEISPAKAAAVTGLAIAPDAKDTIRWELEAPCEGDALLALSYPLKGIERRVVYTATLNQNAETLDISARMLLNNKSKLGFRSATLVLPGGKQLSAPLPLNETFEVPLFTSAGVPFRTLLVYDPAKYGNATMAVLRVLRDRGGEFSDSALFSGKVIFTTGPGTGDYVGEDTLPYLPPRESVDLKLGVVPEVTVARKVVKSTQVDVKSDLRDKLVLFNQDDDVELEVKNLRKSPVFLTVRDTLTGDWTILRSSQPCEKLDAATIEFVVNLAAGETRVISYTSRRLNLQP